MLVGQVSQRFDVPHEPGAWMEFRKLPWRTLEEARRAVDAQAQADHATMAKAYGIELLREIERLGSASVNDAVAQELQARRNAADAPGAYDTATLLRAGIVRWSYSDTPTPEEIDDLDEESARWAKNAILGLTKPARDAEAQKNG